MKLIVREAESPALVNALSRFDRYVTSDIALVEVPRAVRRTGADSGLTETRRVLTAFDTVALDQGVLAPSLRPSVLSASALALGISSLVFVAFDRLCLAAAEAAGLRVDTPA